MATNDFSFNVKAPTGLLQDYVFNSAPQPTSSVTAYQSASMPQVDSAPTPVNSPAADTIPTPTALTQYTPLQGSPSGMVSNPPAQDSYAAATNANHTLLIPTTTPSATTPSTDQSATDSSVTSTDWTKQSTVAPTSLSHTTSLSEGAQSINYDPSMTLYDSALAGLRKRQEARTDIYTKPIPDGGNTLKYAVPPNTSSGTPPAFSSISLSDKISEDSNSNTGGKKAVLPNPSVGSPPDFSSIPLSGKIGEDSNGEPIYRSTPTYTTTDGKILVDHRRDTSVGGTGNASVTPASSVTPQPVTQTKVAPKPIDLTEFKRLISLDKTSPIAKWGDKDLIKLLQEINSSETKISTWRQRSL